MTHSVQEPTMDAWSFARMGFHSNSLAVVCSDIKIDPQKPAYPRISAFQIPDNQEVELLVYRSNSTWMKIRAFREGNHVWYMPYKTFQATDMPDALTAVRQQSLGTGPVIPPVREPLSSWRDKFLAVFLLPELTDFDRAQAREWLSAQCTPGNVVNSMHERARFNNEAARRWLPLWMTSGRRTYSPPMATAQSTANAGDPSQFLPDLEDSDLVVLDQERELRNPWSRWERAKRWVVRLVWGDGEEEGEG